jgi:hypothetical protein
MSPVGGVVAGVETGGNGSVEHGLDALANAASRFRLAGPDRREQGAHVVQHDGVNRLAPDGAAVGWPQRHPPLSLVLLVFPARELACDEAVGVAAECRLFGNRRRRCTLACLDGIDAALGVDAVQAGIVPHLLQRDLWPSAETHLTPTALALDVHVQKPALRAAGLNDQIQAIAVGVATWPCLFDGLRRQLLRELHFGLPSPRRGLELDTRTLRLTPRGAHDCANTSCDSG